MFDIGVSGIVSHLWTGGLHSLVAEVLKPKDTEQHSAGNNTVFTRKEHRGINASNQQVNKLVECLNPLTVSVD